MILYCPVCYRMVFYGPLWPTGKNRLYRPNFCILSIKNHIKGDTRAAPSRVHDQSWTLWFLRFCKAVCTFSKKNTFFKPSEHHGIRLWSLLYFTKVHRTLMDLHGPLNWHCEADFGGPLPIEAPPGSLQGPNWPILFDRPHDNGQT